MGQHAIRANPEPLQAAPGPAPSRRESAPNPAAARSSRRRLHRIAPLLLTFCWRASLLAVAVLAGSGFAITLLAPGGFGPSYSIGRAIDFRSGGNAGSYLREGWTGTSQAGRVTIGPWSDMILPGELPKNRDIQLTLLARPLFAAEDDEFWVDVLIDGTAAARWSFTREDRRKSWHTAIVRQIETYQRSAMHVTFVVGSADPTAQGSALEIETMRLAE